jgi:hypothetical protein
MKITKLPGQIAESVLSIVGIRMGTEEPHYISAPLTDHVELRKYGPRIAAESTVAADEARARDIGSSGAWPITSSAATTAIKRTLFR